MRSRQLRGPILVALLTGIAFVTGSRAQESPDPSQTSPAASPPAEDFPDAPDSSSGPPPKKQPPAATPAPAEQPPAEETSPKAAPSAGKATSAGKSPETGATPTAGKPPATGTNTTAGKPPEAPADDDQDPDAPPPGSTHGTVGTTPGRFEPSEKVRADFDVSFPVDI
jgi:hypothetical protein